MPVAHVIGLYMDSLAGIEKSEFANEDGLKAAMNRSLPMQQRIDACRKVAGRLGVDIDRLLDLRAFHYMRPDELKEAAARGLSIQLHTHRLSMHDGSTGAVQREIEENRSALSRCIDRPREYFRHFCYPSGVTSAGAICALKSSGLRSATTIRHDFAWPGDDPYLLPRFLDNGRLSSIEFEAEMSGFMILLRRPLRTLRHCLRRGRAAGRSNGAARR